MKRTHTLMIAIVLLGYVSVASAENPFQPAFEKACAQPESCKAWIDETQSSPQGKSENAQLLIGSAYVALADYFGANEKDKLAFRVRAREVFSAVLKQNPKSTEAIKSLSAIAETHEERIAYLRQLVALDPTNADSLTSLANALTGDNPTAAQASEAGELMKRAYEVYPGSDREKWQLAGNAVFMLDGLGQHADADALRTDAQQRYGYRDVVARLSRPELMDAEELNSTLTSICENPVIWFGRPKDCVDSVKAVANAVDKAPPNSTAKLVEAASLGMGSAGEVGELLKKVDPNWQQSFTDSLEKFIAAGQATPTTFHTYGAYVRDPHKRLEVFEAGAAKFPNDGPLAVAAGLAEMDLGQRDDAVRNLTRAKGLVTEAQRPAVDQLIQKANQLAQ